MKNLKHTPGPWEITDSFDFDSFISGNTGKFENIICQSPASHSKSCKNYEPWHNNKLLIVAAPEMLAGYIKLCYDFCIPENLETYGREGVLRGEYGWIVLLIEKATGLTIEEIL